MKRIEAKLGKIFEKLERLIKHKGDLRRIEGDVGGRPLSEKTTPLVNESYVYGRDADREAIMELLRRNEENGPNVVVIPIVGMGGIGKTTLAQLVYNDSRVDDLFELKVWVWVSEIFDVTRVMDDILKKVNASVCGIKDPDESLKEELEGKMVLLVLDDVWNIEYSEWDKLLLPLQYAGQGSKTVVTTRNESVARVMQTVNPSYSLKGIGDEDCWQLFARHAFSGVNSGALPHLEAFGREIVRKCKGLPLAAKTLGGLLHSEGDAKEWERISNSNMWGLSNENIPPALRLSYYYLPSHLKRCFAYCAIFPKGYTFMKNELITLWMAEGFLVQSRGDVETERIGEKYFNDLVSRSFFQKSSNDPSSFIMHELIIDLAEYVSGEFCLKFMGDGESGPRLKGGNPCRLPERTRYLSFTSRYDQVSKIFEHIHEVQHLRNFLLVAPGWKADGKVLHDMLRILKRLRVLSFVGSGYIHQFQLPNSIGNLKHLRYLDLSGKSIERLPENMSKLYNLQTLILKQCYYLIKLPTNMSKLVNLQHLDIEGTKLKEMPPKMGKLTKLRKLTDFFLGKQNGSCIKELEKLLHLQEKLSIWNLQNVEDVQDALDANLKGKKQIERLRLTWDGDMDGRDVLEKLEPSENVKELVITAYGGTKFPGWVGNSSFSNMVSLVLDGCKNSTSLPPLGQLPNLEELQIKGFDEVVAVGSEFYGIGPFMEKPFKSLKSLTLLGMPQWKEWNTDAAGAFPHLEELWIEKCPELTNALPCHLPSLLKLDIEECPQLVVSIPEAPKLTRIQVNDGEGSNDRIYIEELSSSRWCLTFREDSQLKGLEQMSYLSSSIIIDVGIFDCSSLKFCQLDLLPPLSTFTIQYCQNLESLCIQKGRHDRSTSYRSAPRTLETKDSQRALRHLKIAECPNLVSFLEGGLAVPDLRRLELEGCINLKSLPGNMHSLLPSLEELELISLPQLDFFPEGGLPSKLNSLCIQDCIKLKVCGLQSLTSLSHFLFVGKDDVESFPEETLLPSTLVTLKIQDLRNLKSLDYKGLKHLTSLSKLEIWRCPQLESMPEEGLPSSLEYLQLWNLANLKSLEFNGLQHLTSLRQLMISDCPKLDSMPEEGLPSSLEYLNILNLTNLKSLGYRGLQQLSSLHKLNIWSCPKLESMPEQGLSSSLEYLEIGDCPLLEKRCRKEIGEDWPKISHIPFIHIQAFRRIRN